MRKKIIKNNIKMNDIPYFRNKNGSYVNSEGQSILLKIIGTVAPNEDVDDGIEYDDRNDYFNDGFRHFFRKLFLREVDRGTYQFNEFGEFKINRIKLLLQNGDDINQVDYEG